MLTTTKDSRVRSCKTLRCAFTLLRYFLSCNPENAAAYPSQLEMKTARRQFIKNTGLALGAAGFLDPSALTAGVANDSSFILRAPRMKLGIVTYNIAKDWDLPAIIKNCAETKFQGVELRTSHKHGVEVSLNKEQRAEVRKRFTDSPVELMGLGSAFDYHTPDQAKLRADIAAPKEY